MNIISFNFHTVSVISVRTLFPFCGLDSWDKQRIIANLVGQVMPSPSSLSHWKQSAWSKSNTFAHAGGLLSCWDFIWVWKVGRWFLSGNFSGLSHCFNHANKAAALKLWAEPCQLQTAAARRSHQSTCRAPSISVPISRPSTLNVGSG